MNEQTYPWYMVNKDGMAALCADQADAEQEAKNAQEAWPHMGPHRAVRLVEVGDAGFTAADMATAAAQGFREGQAAELAAMRAGGEPVAQISGIDEYGPMLGWFKHWKDVAIGTRLYARPRPATPLEEGFTLVAVKGLDDLMYWLDRCESKGHLENCPDLIEPWENFEYRAIAAQQGDSHE